MPTPTNPDVKANLKEATDLLDCMDINDEKLAKIATIISEKIKEDPSIKQIIETLDKSYDEKENEQTFPVLQKLLEHDDTIQLIGEILFRLGNNPEIIENIEKKVLPILFSR